MNTKIHTILIILLTFSSQLLFGQQAINGRVVSNTNETLAGVTLTFANGSTQTAADGTFHLNFSTFPQTITVSYLGYEKQTIQVVDNRPLTINLVPSANAINEVVVTALGISREKKALGYAVQDVKSSEFQTRPANAISAISGKVAGLQVISSGGNMGGSSRVLIRGINSIAGNNQPLYVINGTPIDNGDFNNASTVNGSAGKDLGNVMQDLNPDDIENISVLKGPSAAALYGSRAANGVILITTKKGTKGDRVEISVNTGLDFENIVRLPKRQKLYGQGYSTTFANATINGQSFKIVDYASDESWGPKLDGTPVLQWYALDPESPEKYLKETPWEYPKHDVSYFFKTGISNSNNISLSGSSGETNYRLSYTNKNVGGTTPNASLDKNTLNLAGSTRIGKLVVNSNLTYVRTSSLGKPWTGATNRGIMLNAFQWGGVQVDFKELSNYKRADGTQISWNRTSYDNTAQGEATRFIDNPYWAAYESYLEEKRDRFYGNFGLTYEATDWLSIGARVHGDISTFDTQDRIAVYSRSTSQYEENSNKLNEYNYEFLATAKKNWQDFSLIVNVGANLRDQQKQINNGITQAGLTIPNYYNLKNAASVLIDNNKFHKRVGSIYGSASVGYKDFLYLDATIRNDRSSTLPIQNNSYVYPSATGSFVFSQLDAIKELSWLSFGKVRLGWAKVGNDTDPYQLYKVYKAQQAFEGLPSYALPKTLNNALLKPEMTASWETGLNLQFLKNRIGIDVTYYNNNSHNQILPVPVSQAVGYEFKVLNAGKINNKGIEVTLNATPVKTGSFEWNSTINWSKNRNKVVELDELVNTLTLSSSLVSLVAREKESYGQILGTDFVYAPDGQRVIKADGTYMNTTQLVPLGSVLPDYLFGFQNHFRYKNFNLGFLIDGRVGGKFFSQTYKVGMYAGILDKTAANNVRETGVVLDGVKANVEFHPDGTYTVSDAVKNETNVSAQQWARNEYNGPTAFSVFDATFVKLREVTFGYTIPLKPNKFAKNLGVSVYGRNLWNIYTKSKYIDPEATSSSGNVQGIEGGNIPTPLSYGFNINVKF